MGYHVFGYNPKKKKENETHLDAFLFQLSEPSNVKYVPNNIEKEAIEQITGIKDERPNETLDKVNKTQDEMLQKQAWYILETLTTGSLNYLNFKNLKSQHIIFTPQTLKYYIDELNPGYTKEQIDEIVKQSTETENVPTEESKDKESLEQIYKYNRDDEGKADRDIMASVKAHQMVHTYYGKREDLVEKFKDALVPGNMHKFKEDYKSFINERMNSLPANKRTALQYKNECAKLNLALRDVVAPFLKIDQETIDKMNYGGMTPDEFANECSVHTSSQAFANDAINQYKNVIPNLKPRLPAEQRRQSLNEIGNIIKTLQDNHAKKGRWERFKDWFRSNGTRQTINRIMDDFKKRTSYTDKDFEPYLKSAKNTDGIKEYANNYVGTNRIDFYESGLQNDIKSLTSLSLEDALKDNKQRQEKDNPVKKEEVVENENTLNNVNTSLASNEVQQLFQEQLGNEFNEIKELQNVSSEGKEFVLDQNNPSINDDLDEEMDLK